MLEKRVRTSRASLARIQSHDFQDLPFRALRLTSDTTRYTGTMHFNISACSISLFSSICFTVNSRTSIE